MSLSAGFHTLVYVFLMIVKAVEGAISFPPSNTVAEVNGVAVFNCSAQPSGPLLWILSKDGTTSGEQRITTSCTVNGGFQNHYRTEQPGGQTTCNLVVFSITKEEAGVYQCIDSDRYYALLTVLETPANATTNITTNATEGEFVGLQCSVKYNGSMAPASTLRPIMYWTDINGQNVSSSNYYSNPSEAISTATFEVGRQDKLQFACHVYFQLNVNASNSAGYATNTPTNNYSANTSPIDSYYTPLISNISSEGRNASKSSCGISTVICIATANPEADYTWIDIEEPSKVIPGQSYQYAQFGRSYNCSATNSFNYKTSTDVKTHTVLDQYSITHACKGCRASNMNITGQTCTNRRCTCMFACNMTMVCDADAYPDPTYQWKQGGRVIKDNSSTLVAVHDGTYSCVATNFIDGQPFEAQIDVDVSNCSRFTKLLIGLSVWAGCCMFALFFCALCFHSKGGFKLIMGCSFPFLCTKLESNKCLNALWIGLFILTSCISSGIAMALITCFCFNKKEEGSGKIPTKPWIFVGISCILFLIYIILCIVALVGISRCI